MPISSYVGLPRHGKSYGVVENVILPALKKKRRVITNIPMHIDVLERDFGVVPEQVTIKEIQEDPAWWKQNCPGAVVVLDELWKLWPAGLNAKNAREEDKSFLAEHGHMVCENGFSTEVVFVTQDLGQIASFARALVETTYRVEKLVNIGSSKRYRVDVYSGPVTGPAPSKSKRMREMYGKYSPSVYQYYISHTQSEAGLAGDESKTDTRSNILKGGALKAIAMFIVIGGFVVWYGLGKVAEYYGGKGDSEVVEQAQEPVKQIDQVRSEPALAPPVKQTAKFLSKADLLLIVWNNGHFPDVEFRYQVTFKEQQVVMTTAELEVLDYALVPINECLVRIKGPDYDGYAMCPKHEENRGWVETLVTETAS